MGEPRAFYNEIDPRAAAWMRELINQGHIAPGDVDERDIRDVTPAELARYTQCHFFAGIGVWSYALRRAGWPDNRRVWTGSCPCQPFSQAGAKAGFDDERHLWPAWQWLIEQCGPVDMLGEQVANSNVDPWIDLVQADLEGMGYAFGCVPLPAAGVGAPNIRERAFWLAHSQGIGSGAGLRDRCTAEQRRTVPANDRSASGVANADGGDASAERQQRGREQRQQPQDGGLRIGHNGAPPTDGFWRDADWLLCRDGKWRPVEPGTFPLAHGAPARVGRLRGYGNAINAEVATHFIREAMTLIDGPKGLAA